MTDTHTQQEEAPMIPTKTKGFGATFREFVFGIEDGMVSTMGAITGIAVGSGNHAIVVLSGFVIIAVESISMGVGSYISNKSERDMEKRTLKETKEVLAAGGAPSKKNLEAMFMDGGWSQSISAQMSQEAMGNTDLLLKEVAYRDLHLAPEEEDNIIKNGFVMWGSYILGGMIPLLPYFVINVPLDAIPVSVAVTLIGLFVLGAYTTKFTLRKWWQGGLEVLILAGLAGAVGYVVGRYFNGMMGL